MNSGPDGSDETVDRLRADLKDGRRQIDRTISEIEARLSPDRVAGVLRDRLREAAAPWKGQPVDQARALGREIGTRIREMAWMSPLGLGLSAAVVGYLIGRRRR